MNDILDSKLGSWLVALYAAISIAMAGYSLFCKSAVCQRFIIAPIMPWALLLETELGVSISVVIYPLILLLNASVLYAIGVLIEWFLRRF